MKKILRRGEQIFELSTSPAGRNQKRLYFSHPAAAQRFLRGFLRDHFDNQTLRRVLAESMPSGTSSRLTEGRLTELLTEMLVAGRIKVLTTPAPSRRQTSGTATTTIKKKDEAPPFPVEEKVKETDWIEFAIIDAETGQPVNDVTLKIKLPSGEERNFTTKNGKIEIKDVDPGSCDILKMSDAFALEVTEVS